MKTRLSIIALLATMACDTEDPGLQFNAFKSIEEECVFTESNPDLLGFTFDPQLFESLTLYGSLQSTLNPPSTLLDQNANSSLPGQVTTNVTEFEYVFECDLSGFAGPRQLFLPGPSRDPSVPFCRNPSDPDTPFLGLDLVPVFATLEGDEITTVATRVISPRLSSELEDLFDLSVPAAECCDGETCDVSAPSTACQDVQTAINQERILQGQALELSRFREAVRVTTNMPDPNFLGPLLLTVRGNYRGITNRGASLVSNEANFTIDVCAGCRSIPFEDLEDRANMGDTDAQDELEERRIIQNCFE